MERSFSREDLELLSSAHEGIRENFELLSSAHEDISATDAELRKLLGAPDDLPLVQWRWRSPHLFSPHLAGCTWRIVGPAFRGRGSLAIPPYPFFGFLWRARPSDPWESCHVQVWLWRTSRDEPYKLSADLRWAPGLTKPGYLIAGVPGPPSKGDQELIRKWLVWTKPRHNIIYLRGDIGRPSCFR